MSMVFSNTSLHFLLEGSCLRTLPPVLLGETVGVEWEEFAAGPAHTLMVNTRREGWRERGREREERERSQVFQHLIHVACKHTRAH